MKNKKGFEFSFSWIFAIVIGAMIIFLAVYGVTRLIGGERQIQGSETAKEIGIILNPLETSIEEGASGKILLNSKTILYNECDSGYGAFGLQDLSISTKSGFGNEKNIGVTSSFRNKYIFSSEEVEGEEYRVFSKQLNLPFKVADLIYMRSESDDYCIVNPPKVIEEEIAGLNLEGVSIVNRESECISGSEKVRIEVVSSGIGFQGRVKKGFDEVYFVTPELAFGAIFADKSIYECQVKRLMKRTSELALLYRAKSVFLTPKGCRSNLEFELENFANKTFSLERSFYLAEIQRLSENLRRKNNDLHCELF